MTFSSSDLSELKLQPSSMEGDLVSISQLFFLVDAVIKFINYAVWPSPTEASVFAFEKLVTRNEE